MQKRIAVITGTRAEYGLLHRVFLELQKQPSLSPELVVTGAHLAPEYGETVREIEADGLPISARLPILKFGSGQVATAHTAAYAMEQFTGLFSGHRPDAVLVLGDRYEIFAAASAAAMLGIPVIHISGGDVTLGAADDWYRHCITKMASLHFPSCAEYARRLVRMGEDPARVHNVGGLGDENIRKMPRMPLDEIAESIGFSLDAPYALVTFHPETAGAASPLAQMEQLLAAMEQMQNMRWIITKANADAGGEGLNVRLERWCEGRENAVLVASLGVKRYLSAMEKAAMVVGNSSSGVVETPTFGVPAVNIGQRQAGRILCGNVLCCPAEESAILAAMQKAVSPQFTAAAHRTVSPYNGGDTASRIAAITAKALEDPAFAAPKGFYDGPVPDSL